MSLSCDERMCVVTVSPGCVVQQCQPGVTVLDLDLRFLNFEIHRWDLMSSSFICGLVRNMRAHNPKYSFTLSRISCSFVIKVVFCNSLAHSA